MHVSSQIPGGLTGGGEAGGERGEGGVAGGVGLAGGGGSCTVRGPQSAQSVPRGQREKCECGPASSHWPSEDHEQLLEQSVSCGAALSSVAIATSAMTSMKSLARNCARRSIKNQPEKVG